MNALEMSYQLHLIYQYQSSKHDKYWGQLKAECTSGKCSLNICILNNPTGTQKVDLLTVLNMIGNVNIHSNLCKARVTARAREELGKEALEKTSFIDYVDQFSAAPGNVPSSLTAIQK